VRATTPTRLVRLDLPLPLEVYWPCWLFMQRLFAGKWHLGMAAWNQTPTFRGYNSFHGMHLCGMPPPCAISATLTPSAPPGCSPTGYYSGGQDYYTHKSGNGFDLHVDKGPRCGANCSIVDWANYGTYRCVRRKSIRSHGPVFAMLNPRALSIVRVAELFAARCCTAPLPSASSKRTILPPLSSST
jgi:hypothetical protein